MRNLEEIVKENFNVPKWERLVLLIGYVMKIHVIIMHDILQSDMVSVLQKELNIIKRGRLVTTYAYKKFK
jgi:hypothetical protein